MRQLKVVLICFAVAAPGGALAEAVFHFYGAEDCPPCMAFKRNHLENVRAQGEAEGFIVSANIIPHTRDVPELGIFGDADPILREALEVGDLVAYPPIFFVTQSGKVTSVHGANWESAKRAAASSSD